MIQLDLAGCLSASSAYCLAYGTRQRDPLKSAISERFKAIATRVINEKRFHRGRKRISHLSEDLIREYTNFVESTAVKTVSLFSPGQRHSFATRPCSER